jgi:hypothetical protein
MHRQTIRNRLLSAPCRTFGVLVIFWLNLVVTPCAMALDAGRDCPHPPAATAQSAGHHGHHVADAATHDCTTLQSDCCDSPAANLDARSGKFKYTPDSPAMAYSETALFSNPARPVLKIASFRPEPIGASPPLHKLYCVYLD